MIHQISAVFYRRYSLLKFADDTKAVVRHSDYFCESTQRVK